jgi:SAM-dependent methyltransferase
LTYDPQSVSSFFNEYGQREWNRLIATPADEISLYLHTHYLKTYIPSGSSVLEIGAGAGRFTQILAEIGAKIVVGDISPGQLDLHKHFSEQLGFDYAVEDRQEVDICNMSRFSNESFDHVVAYGGPFSYVLEQRNRAIDECLRVVRPGGLILASVMSLWGSAHRALVGVLDTPPEANQRITTTGDITPETFPGRQVNFMHLFRAKEVSAWLAYRGLDTLALSASGVLANGYGSELDQVRQDAVKWAELLRMDLEASAEPGCLDLGTHLIFVARK